jgi:DNA-3-methyladenine glycosylase
VRAKGVIIKVASGISLAAIRFGFGKTNRTEIMFHAGGVAYVYLCYGIHTMFNIVAGREGNPEAVLIRGVEGAQGPGRLTKSFSIGLDLNGENLAESSVLWVEDDSFSAAYKTGKRIGIKSATEEYRDKLWRFTLQ